MTITTKQYEEKKIAFLHRHKDWRVDTSPMDEYGRYHKNYICTDGAVFTEINEPCEEEAVAVAVVRGTPVTIKQTVKLLRTEGWSTDDATSMICYEPF